MRLSTGERVGIRKLFREYSPKLKSRPIITALFVMLAFLVGTATLIPGYSFFGPPKTRVTIIYGDEKYDFFTTEKTLQSALAKEGIEVTDKDRTDLALEESLTGKAVKGAIVKALPVVIMDGYTKILGRSTSLDPATILSDNGIEVAPEDRVSIDLILDPIAVGGAGMMVSLERAPTYNIYVDEKNAVVRSWDPKVETLVQKSGVKINPQDELNYRMSAQMLPGETLVITRINELDIDVLDTVAFETQNTTSSAIAFGQSKTLQAGANGKVKKTYHVIYKNGEEVSRRLVRSAIIAPVQNKIVVRGSISGKSNWGPYYEDNYGPYTTSFHYGYVGRTILITNNDNGRQIKVKIVDKGPTNALLDLSTTAFKALGGSIMRGNIPNVSVVLLD